MRDENPSPGLRSLAGAIRRDYLAYIRQREHWSPRINDVHRRHGRQLRNVVTYLLGLLQVPRLGLSDTLYVFHSTRHAGYMKAFDRDSVLVTGGVEEWALALREGYRFVWAFGAIAAVHAAVYFNWSQPLVVMLALWRRALRRPKRVVVFLYEDTAQHGTFMAHVVRGLPNCARSVCIAHGYYGGLDVPLRVEGALCDYNFVWDERQRTLLSGSHSNIVVIGLPYDARAQQTPVETLVLVGVGHPDCDVTGFEQSMHCYAEIAAIAARRPGLAVVYRPHPSERVDARLTDDLRRRFPSLDALPLTERLGGPRAVFVGFASSLLHEAAVAGHLVVHVAGVPGFHAVFDHDLELAPGNMAPIEAWLEQVCGLPPPTVEDPVAEADALERFRRAVARIE